MERPHSPLSLQRSPPAPSIHTVVVGILVGAHVDNSLDRSTEGTYMVLTEEAIPQTFAFPAPLTGTTPGFVSSDPDEGPESLPFDRRRLPRKVMSGFAMAVFTAGIYAGTVVRVELIDASHTGLGIRCPIPVEPGASFSLIPEDRMMPRQVGVAIRCEGDGEQFHLGLRMRRNLMAA